MGGVEPRGGVWGGGAPLSGVFLAAAVWGGQWGGHIFIWEPRISDDIMHDSVNGVI